MGTTLGTQPELQAGNTDGIMYVYAEFPECFKKPHGILGLRQAPRRQQPKSDEKFSRQ